MNAVKLLMVGVILVAALIGVTLVTAHQSLPPSGEYPYLIGSSSEKEVQERVIRVTGYGTVSSNPDMAYIGLAVESVSETAREAQMDNAANMDRVISALNTANVPKSGIETLQYSISPRYDYDSKPPSIVGYICRNEIRVTLEDIERTGSIVDTAVEAGANQILYIEFTFSPERRNQLSKVALESAVKDGEIKAEVVAEALNLDIKGPVQIDLTSYQVPVQPYTLKAAEQATPIIPGEVQVTATVTMAFDFE